jgi:acetyl/propionyl-CoA carboxylase alpha subunit
MAALLTLAEAKDHLNVTGDDHNADIAAKTLQASDVVLKHIDTGVIAGWSDGSVIVPGNVKAATCFVLAYLYVQRGDAMAASAETWQAVERILVPTRGAVMA